MKEVVTAGRATANVLESGTIVNGEAGYITCEGAASRYNLVVVNRNGLLYVMEENGKWSIRVSTFLWQTDPEAHWTRRNEMLKNELVPYLVSHWAEKMARPWGLRDAEVIADALVQVYGFKEVEGE